MSGYVYILHSATVPHLVKIGFSTRPQRRVRHLRTQCQLPDLEIVHLTPYIEGQARRLERLVHRELRWYRERRPVDRGGRTSFQREWFRCSVARARRDVDMTMILLTDPECVRALWRMRYTL
ncbi:Meiotically up-regulated protein [Lasiodiplodia theobromae]|uniref:Meiotically up-regulated protein n=1 Tax=Lasiodiplodia theobromae TaxID=45133 RepID=UPI0015C37775|nr:Meiotically up-regulated protein [Lasiodiplodia theobromae]KAF4545902.1 Meiotically up-regulated protein [Lasiodiplodia theobromae]